MDGLKYKPHIHTKPKRLFMSKDIDLKSSDGEGYPKQRAT